MSKNKVVYFEEDSKFPWTKVYGEELLNFLQCYSSVYISKVESWRVGERRLIWKDQMDEALACFPLDFVVEYA